MADFFTVLGAVDASISLFEKTNLLKGKINMLKKWLKEGKTQIAILGGGGTGKTTLAYYLTNEPQYKDTTYEETPIIEKINIDKNIIGEYWVAPGQKDRRERYLPEIFREISNGKICGIVHVVSYGYHSIDAQISMESHRLYRQGMSSADFLNILTRENRKTEIEIVQELKHRIKDSNRKIWMITLVLKQDLWWNEREEVKRFYTEGTYNTEIAEMLVHKGVQNFEHIYVSASLLANNFWVGDKLLQPVAQGYDENIRLSNIATFLGQLNGFLK